MRWVDEENETDKRGERKWEREEDNWWEKMLSEKSG